MSTTTTGSAGSAPAAFRPALFKRIVVVLIGGMFLDGYVLGIIGTVISPITDELQFTTTWQGLIVASSLIGIFLGSPIGGWASDRWGRKPLFMIDMLLFLVGSVMQFWVDGPVGLFIARLIMGLAVGVEYSVGWPMLSEFAPTRSRGRLLALNLVAFYAGFMVAFLTGYLLVTNTDTNWRIILGSSTLIAVVLFLGRLGMPESPRWLMNKGRTEEAHRIAEMCMEHPEDLDDIKAETPKQGTFGMLFSRQHWRSTLFTSAFWLCAVTPYFAIATFAQSVLESYGLSSGLAGGVGLSALALAGVVLTVMLINKVGRRALTVPPQWLCAGLLVLLGLWSGAPALAVLIGFLVFSFFNAMYNTLTGIYPGEVFPTEIRGIGTGFATAVSRIGAATGTFIMPWSMTHLGPNATILGVAGLAIIGAALSQWLAPETKGKTLTEAAAGFGH
ncbi:MAG: MFS transporter [Dermatophilus congolensis]|nr:MFS transporter [Dermatophilus congolensis]